MLGSEQLTLKLCLVGGKTTQDTLYLQKKKKKIIAKPKKNSHTVNPHQLQLYNKLNRAILGESSSSLDKIYFSCPLS